MKNIKIKKISSLFLALLLTSCTSINTQRVFDRFDGIFTDKNNEEVVEINPDVTFDNKIVENKILTSDNVDIYLNIVKDRLRANQKVEGDEFQPSYKILVGEYLTLKTNGENTAKIATSPKNTNARVKIVNGKLYFRSIYKGNYAINLYQNNYLTKKINVVVTSKYNFSESNIYDIILENSAKNNKILKNAVTLYKIYYPNGKNHKNVSYELLKYGYTNKDNSIINEALEVLKSDINSFDDSQKNLILKAAALSKKRIFIPEKIYFTADKELQKTLADYIQTKDILDKKDKIFLERNFQSIFNKISTEKQKDDAKINNSEDTSVKNNSFLGAIQKKLNLNKKNDIKEPKKALIKEKSGNKKAEIYYNLMEKHVKSGDRIKALRYLSLIKQQDPNSEWAKKAEKLANEVK